MSYSSLRPQVCAFSLRSWQAHRTTRELESWISRLVSRAAQLTLPPLDQPTLGAVRGEWVYARGGIRVRVRVWGESGSHARSRRARPAAPTPEAPAPEPGIA